MQPGSSSRGIDRPPRRNRPPRECSRAPTGRTADDRADRFHADSRRLLTRAARDRKDDHMKAEVPYELKTPLRT